MVSAIDGFFDDDEAELDDVVVVALALRYAARQVPRDIFLDAWPGDPHIVERLLGATGARPGRGAGTDAG